MFRVRLMGLPALAPLRAMSVQTNKNPLDLPIPAPVVWTTGMADAPSDPTRMMTYPDCRSASTSVPYTQTTRVGTATRIVASPWDIPMRMSSVK